MIYSSLASIPRKIRDCPRSKASLFGKKRLEEKNCGCTNLGVLSHEVIIQVIPFIPAPLRMRTRVMRAVPRRVHALFKMKAESPCAPGGIQRVTITLLKMQLQSHIIITITTTTTIINHLLCQPFGGSLLKYPLLLKYQLIPTQNPTSSSHCALRMTSPAVQFMVPQAHYFPPPCLALASFLMWNPPTPVSASWDPRNPPDWLTHHLGHQKFCLHPESFPLCPQKSLLESSFSYGPLL